MWKLTISDVQRQEFDTRTHAMELKELDRKMEIHVKNSIKLVLDKKGFTFTMEESGEASTPSFKRPPRVFYNQQATPEEKKDVPEKSKKKGRPKGSKNKSGKTDNKKRAIRDKPADGTKTDDKHDGTPEGEPQDI